LRHCRDECHPKIGSHHLQQGLQARCRETAYLIRVMQTACLKGVIAQAVAVVEQQNAFLGQGLDAHAAIRLFQPA